MNEREELLAYLEATPCPHCGGLKLMKLSGMVYYTDPLGWEWKCSCNGRGTVGYDSIDHIDLPPDKQEELSSGAVEDIRTFLHTYGTLKPKKIVIEPI